MAISLQGVVDPLQVWFYGGVFGVGLTCMKRRVKRVEERRRGRRELEGIYSIVGNVTD